MAHKTLSNSLQTLSSEGRVHCQGWIRGTTAMSEQNPIRVFVTHTFTEHPDYLRVFEYLESLSNFFYTNCSDHTTLPSSGGKQAVKDELLRQIAGSEIVVVVSTMYNENRDWLSYQMDAADANELPIIALEPFGGAGSVPMEVKARAAEVVPWNDRMIIDAIKREARHEETTRWDVIEFDMS